MSIPPKLTTTTVNRPIYPALAASPYSGSWWTSQTVARVPETSVGYLVAQGWQITSTYTEDDVTYYDMSRQSMMNWMILQSLLNAYTFAYNEGRDFNATRYNDLILSWGNLIENTREQLDMQGDLSDAHMSIYATTITDLLSDLEADVALSEAELTSISDDIDAQLDLFVAKLNELGGVYDAHEIIARGLLVDLGTTETARINEQFDNLLTKSKQGLVDRGLYSSIIFSSIQTRIERERSEALSKWNDQLNREILENQHRLFAEEMDTKRAEIAGRTTFTATAIQKGEFVINGRNKLISMLLQGRLEKANAVLGVRDREEKTMIYQLDTYNNVVMALHAMQERRTDEYPDLEGVSKLIAGIADAGGGWINP